MNGPWLFGYGSIIWKTGFDYVEQRRAFVRGWTRRFWQASTDHRGTDVAPGRVVTLSAAPGEVCWGIAYQLPADRADQIIGDLDHREKGGYERFSLPIEFPDGESVAGITYHATEHNPFFLGEAPDEEMARQIAHAVGPSGSNKEYILRLAHALSTHDITDHHVDRLARLVMETESRHENY